MTLKIAAIQMVSGNDVAQNLYDAEKLLAEASSEGAQVAVLPETFALMGLRNQRQVGDEESTADGPLRSFIARQASLHKMWIVAGTIPAVTSPGSEPLPKDKVYASCFVVNDQGLEVGQYDKIHLFDVDVNDAQGSYRESDTFCPGREPGVVETPWGLLGLAVCYDLRFPEYFRILAERGCVMVAVPAAFTYQTGKAHWELLMRARAVENLFFMIGAGQGGEHSSRRQTWGDSMIVNPWGEIVKRRPSGAGIVISEIDLSSIDDYRRKMPVLNHRKF